MINASLYVPVDKLEDCLLNLNYNGYKVVSTEIDVVDESIVQLFYVKVAKINIDMAVNTSTARKFMIQNELRK